MEGDGRTSKRLQESLGKHVKMLEGALKKEREKRKKAEVEGKVAEKQTEGAPAKEETKADSTCECGNIAEIVGINVVQHCPQSPPKQLLTPKRMTPRMPKSNKTTSETSPAYTLANAFKRLHTTSSLLPPPSSRLSKRSKRSRTTNILVKCPNSHWKRCMLNSTGQSNNQTTPALHLRPPYLIISLRPLFEMPTLLPLSLDPNSPNRMRSSDATTPTTISSTKPLTLLLSMPAMLPDRITASLRFLKME